LPDRGWSAVGDLGRYTPKPEEMDADPPTYGIDYHYQLALLGGKGSQMVGGTVWGRAKVSWTEEDCYMIFGTGNDGQTQPARIGRDYGLAGYLGYVEWNDTLYWFSKYNSGSYLAATYGSAPEGSRVLDRVAIGSDYAVTIYDAGFQIADVWQAAGDMTSKVIKVSWGEWGEWNNIPAAQRTSLSIDDKPGSIVIDSIDVTAPDPTWSVQFFRLTTSSLSIATDHGIDKTVDKNTTTYFQYGGTIGTENVIGPPAAVLQVLSATGNWNSLPGVVVGESSALATYTFPLQKSTAFRLKVMLPFYNNDTEEYGGIEHYFTYVVPVAYYDTIKLYGYDFTRTNDYTYNIKLYEFYIEGVSSTTATLITEAPTATSKAVLSGLTASSQRDLGMFWARFTGNGSDYLDNLTISIRCGNTAPVSIVTGTASGVVSGYTLTDAAKTFTTACEIGDYVTINSVNYMITGVAATVLTLASAPAAGTYSYVVYGSAAAATTWTEWYTLTTRELRRGKPLRELLTRAGEPSYIATIETGLLYVQAKAVFALDSQGDSPELDYMVFTAVLGDNIASTFPISHNDEQQFISFKVNSGSTANDVEAVRNVNGAWSVIEGKENTNYLGLADRTIMAFAGFCGALQYAGRKAYYGVANAYRDLLGEFETPPLTGKLQGGKLAVGIDEYATSESINPTIGVDVATANPVLGWATAYGTTWYGLWTGDPGLSVQANDGNVYFLMSYDNTTTPKLDLIKITPALVTTRTNIYTSPKAYATSLPCSICLSNDGGTIYMFWGGVLTATNYIGMTWFRTFDVATQTLGTASKPTSSDLTTTHYRSVSSAVADNGDVYCSFLIDATSDTCMIYRSTNGTTWVQDTSISDVAYTKCKHLFKNRHGCVSLVGPNVADDMVIHERTATGWGSATTISTTYANMYYQITYNGADYVIFNDNGDYFKIYKNDDSGWTLVKTITTGSAYVSNDLLMTIYNNQLVVFYTNSIGAEALITGDGTNWSDELRVETVNITGTKVIPRCVAGTAPWLLWGIVATEYWKPYVITYGSMLGDNPLYIKVKKNGYYKTRYAGTDLINDLTMLPKGLSMQGGQNSAASKLAVNVQSYSGFKLDSIEFTAEDTLYE